MNRINLYIFSQILKSCTLVFFILVSIAWLMQLSRLFSIMNNLQIKFFNIFNLSLWLIPNLINITLPFVILFGLILAFVKFDKDKEILAIFSLGLTTEELKKPIMFFIVMMLSLYLILNFLLSPFTYSVYKEKEFTLRNSIEIDKINISNFIKLDNNLVIDFKKENDNFKDILINYINEDNNIIYSKKGIIKNRDNKLIFTLFDGFKLVIDNEEIEKLKFDNYKIEFPDITKNRYDNYDKNTLSIYDLLKNRNQRDKLIIIQRSFDILIIISFVLYFYLYVIKKNNYSLKNILLFIILTIFLLTSDNLIENFEFNFILFFLINAFNILLMHILAITLIFTKFYE